MKSGTGVMRPASIFLGAVAYIGVSAALYVETGDPHSGGSWPVLVALAVMLVSIGVDKRQGCLVVESGDGDAEAIKRQQHER